MQFVFKSKPFPKNSKLILKPLKLKNCTFAYPSEQKLSIPGDDYKKTIEKIYKLCYNKNMRVICNKDEQD